MDETHTLSVQEAATRFGVSAPTIRSWIKEGRLQAVKRSLPQGYEWRVILPGQANDQVALTDDQLPLTNDQLALTDDQLPFTAQVAFLQTIERLHQENVQLAGQVGFLQAQLQQAQEQNRLLTAEKKPTEQPVEEPEPATPMHQRKEVLVPKLTRQGRVLRSLLRRLGIH